MKLQRVLLLLSISTQLRKMNCRLLALILQKNNSNLTMCLGLKTIKVFQKKALILCFSFLTFTDLISWLWSNMKLVHMDDLNKWIREFSQNVWLYAQCVKPIRGSRVLFFHPSLPIHHYHHYSLLPIQSHWLFL